jgi:hypothetical protein
LAVAGAAPAFDPGQRADQAIGIVTVCPRIVPELSLVAVCSGRFPPSDFSRSGVELAPPTLVWVNVEEHKA